MQPHSHDGGHTNAPPPSTTSSGPDTHTEQLQSLLHLLPSLEHELQLNTTSHLYPLDLQDLSLSCRAARDMVYSAHGTKLTFTTSNMWRLPTHATMSERYPAVSHIAINYDNNIRASSTEEIHRAAECLHSLVQQNSAQTMSGITQLDLILSKSAARIRPFSELAGLLKICTSLKRLEVRCRLPPEGVEGVSSVVLVLCEQTAGQGLQHHGDLLDHGADLGQMLGSAACRAELRQLVVGDLHIAHTEAVDLACSALPHLSALRDLTVHANYLGRQYHLLTSQPQLTMLTNLDISLSSYDGDGHIDLDMPALRQLTRCGCCNSTTPIHFSSSMQSLTRLRLEHITLQPTHNIRVLSSLQHLTLKYCIFEGPASFLTSDIQALPCLTYLSVDHLLGPHNFWVEDVTCSLHLETVTQLLELSIDGGGGTFIPSVPTGLASLHVKAASRDRAVSMPVTWHSLRKLVRLTLSWKQQPVPLYDVGGDYQEIFPVVAQMTALEHLDMEMVQGTKWHSKPVMMDPSCLDILTRLTSLKLSTNGAKLATPEWPRLVQAERLQHLAIQGCADCSTLPLPPSLVKVEIHNRGDIMLPHALSNCSLLRSLCVKSLSCDAVINGISRLSPLASLQMLHLLGRKSATSEADLATIARLSCLQSLVLEGGTNGSIRCLSALRQLTWLELQDEYEELMLLQTEGVFPRLCLLEPDSSDNE